MLSGLDDMQFFVEVVRSGSITRASQRLGIPKSSGSRRLQQLEARLRVQLLKRSTRTVQPTDVGRIFYERCLRVLEEVAVTEEIIGVEARSPRGKLRVAIPSTLGMPYFSRWISGFLAQYPEVDVEVETGPGERLVDLVSGNYDVWFKYGAVPDSGLILKRLGVMHRSLYASPDYLAANGAPMSPQALGTHNCLSVSDQPYHQTPWRLGRGRQSLTVEVRGNAWVNNLGMARELARAGLGVAMLPDLFVRQDVAAGALMRLLPDWPAEPVELNLVMPGRDLLPAKTRLFVDFVAGKAHELITGA